jgi:anti-anti-sigma factor
MKDAQPFSIAVSLGPDSSRVFLRGALDVKSAAEVHARVYEAVGNDGASRRSLLMVDLAEVTFCDAAGLRALCDVADRCRRLGMTMRLVNVPIGVRRIMQLTDTLAQFSIEIDPLAAESA